MAEKEVKLINLTPHDVTFVRGDMTMIIPASGTILRLPEETEVIGDVMGVPLVRKTLGDAAMLPPVEDGTFYIVSLPTAQAVHRPDFLVADDYVRDGKGQIIGARRLAVLG